MAKARLAPGFADFAGIFPVTEGERDCSALVGVGVRFSGTCSTRVIRGGLGSHTVVFTQDFEGAGFPPGSLRYTWIVRVPPGEPAYVAREVGNGIVQLIP